MEIDEIAFCGDEIAVDCALSASLPGTTTQCHPQIAYPPPPGGQ